MTTIENARSEAWYRRPTAVWTVLVLATVATTWVFSERSFSATVSLVGTFALVGWKVRLILLDFMELRSAPWIPRIAFELWAVGVPAMVVSFYLAS